MSRLLSIVVWSVLPAAFIGPGTVTTAASAGASFGSSLLWALVFSTVATIVLQEMAARLTIASGLELGEAIAQRHGLLLRSLAGVAVIFGCAAYEAGNFAGAIRGVQLLHDLPRSGILVVAALACTLLLWSTSTTFVARLLGVIVAMMGLCFVYAAIVLRPEWSDFATAALRPSLPQGSSSLAIALIGTTVVPYNLFLGSSIARGRSLAEARLGLTIAIGIGGVISAAILIVGSALAGPMDFVALSELLRARVGSIGAATLGVGLAAAGLSSAITAPLAAAFAARAIFGDVRATDWSLCGFKFRAVWLGVLGFGAAIGLSQLPIVPVIVTAQIVNGLLLPLCALFLLLAMNAGGPLPRSQRNGLAANFGGAVVLLTTAGLGLRAILRALSLVTLLLLVACGAQQPKPMLFHVTTSATPLLTHLVAIWQPSSPDAPKVEINSGSSRELITQLQVGANGDLLLLASQASMQELIDAGRIEENSVSIVLGNELILLSRVATNLQDLSGLRVGLGEVGVPVGDYARAFLLAAKLPAAIATQAVILPNEAALLSAVEQGALDAVFVYASTAARADAKLVRVELPAAQRPQILYPVAAMTAAGASFVRFLETPAAQELIRQQGFQLREAQ